MDLMEFNGSLNPFFAKALGDSITKFVTSIIVTHNSK